jgi:hypothetical protein
VYARWAPGLSRRSDLDGVRSDWIGEIGASGRYGAVNLGEFPWQRRHVRDSYLALLETYSDHALLPADQRAGLFDAIGATIARAGGKVELAYVAMAFVARRID